VKRLLAAALSAAVFLPGAAARPPTVPSFSHVVVIMFENKDAAEVPGNSDAPTFSGLARRGASLANYKAVSHPSLPNYIALVSGSTQGIRSDCTDCLVDGMSLADTLTHAKRTWKAYAEGLPSPGFTGASAGSYAKKHVPFLYFRNVLSRPRQRKSIVPLAQLTADLKARRLPDFSFVVPDLCHDMHDCSVATGDNWLGHWLKILVASKELRGGAVFVLFDESHTWGSGDGGHVPAYVVGPAVRAGATTKQAVSHYSVLATIEASWRLPRLGASAHAAPIRGIWRGGK
jgi:phosphatidylinositol-3-phosphatase